MNHNHLMKILAVTFIIIVFMCIISISNTVHGKSKSEWLSDNPCMIKQIITQKTICLDKECLISETKVPNITSIVAKTNSMVISSKKNKTPAIAAISGTESCKMAANEVFKNGKIEYQIT